MESYSVQPSALPTHPAIDEGVIKFQCQWLPGMAPDPETIGDLMQWRDRLYSLGLIGTYANGIGFGNISQRLTPDTKDDSNPGEHPFVITGTQTGHIPTLGANHYTTVTHFDVARNGLTCRGPVQASSESLTHGIIYQDQPWVTSIIHVHNPELWHRLLGQVPTTRAEVPYGTPAMAKEVQRLFQEESLAEYKLLAMAGHEDGVIALGETLEIAGQVLLRQWPHQQT